MSRARTLYPDAKEGGYTPFCDYGPIICSFGEVLIQVDDEDYSGDTRVLYHRDGRYGFLIFGWGSCSGCDALQACDTFADCDQLIDEIENDIKWFDTLDEVKTYVADKHGREGEFYYHSAEWSKFKDAVLAL
jgi:hypothetical protein